jgi:hypothetical protein
MTSITGSDQMIDSERERERDIYIYYKVAPSLKVADFLTWDHLNMFSCMGL